MTQLLSPKLGLLLPQPRLPTSSLPWRGEEPSLELGQDIKTSCHITNFVLLNQHAVLTQQKTGIKI